MNDDAVYDAYLLGQPDGAWLAHFADLPGGYAVGATRDDAVARLTEGVATYFAWLASHDEYTPISHAAPQVNVIETATAGSGPAAGLTAFYDADAQPVSTEDLDWWLAVLGWAYDDLIAAARANPAGASMLSAVAEAQRRLAALATGSAANGADAAPTPDPFADVEGARRGAFAVFRAAAGERDPGVSERDGQRWSVRRGLRESALLARRAMASVETAR